MRPNEISLERSYIQTHIHATRSAFGLEKRVREVEFKAKPEAAIDVAKHKAVLDNVRLWDWRAFQATVSQIQALRPYYVFADTDVDRYTINGQYRQVLLSPRELDLRQLPDARTRWINPHFIYTHGYGLVMAKVSQITPDGLPNLLVKDAPPQIEAKGLKHHAAGNLLRRGDARAGLRAHRAAGIQLSVGREKCFLHVRRQGRISRSPPCPCGWPRPFAKATPISC